MALADIIRRITEDAQADAARIMGDAEQTAAAIVEEATQRAAQTRAATLATAEKAAATQVETLVAAQRLAGRDRALAARRELVDAALADVVTRLESLPAAEYAHFLAVHVVASAFGGERVVFSATDSGAKDSVAAEVARLAPSLALEWSAETTDALSRGVELRGNRVHSVVSPASVVADRHDELVLELASALFGNGEA